MSTQKTKHIPLRKRGESHKKPYTKPGGRTLAALLACLLVFASLHTITKDAKAETQGSDMSDYVVGEELDGFVSDEVLFADSLEAEQSKTASSESAVPDSGEGTKDSEDPAPPDASEASGTPDASDASDTLEAPEVQEEAQAADVPEAREEPDAEEALPSNTPLARRRSPLAPTGDSLDAGSFGQISLVKFVQVANGLVGGLVLDSEGSVWTYGYNIYGQLGLGVTSAQQDYCGGMKRIPYFTQNNIRIVEIGASYQTRYALSDQGVVYAWGDGGQGAMGNATVTRENPTPLRVAALPQIAHIYPSDSYIDFNSCFALDVAGDLWAWGNNYSGKLGLGNDTTVLLPVKVFLPAEFDAVRTIRKVSCGRTSAFILDSQGDLWSSGADYYGQQANGSGAQPTDPLEFDKPNSAFTKIDRATFGMGRIIDVDASYSALQTISDRIVAADEYGSAWEWGSTYGDGSSAAIRVDKQSPQKIGISSSEIVKIGYTPRAMAVTSSEQIGLFIDQHGRPWSWGSGYYYGFGTDGGWDNSNDEQVSSSAAEQKPHTIGDGDTQALNSEAKVPVYGGGTKLADAYRGYGFNSLHPTIYDEKYMLKDAAGFVLDNEGNRIKYANATILDGVSGLTPGQYYRVDSAGKISSPATIGTPAIKPSEAAWINLAHKPIPYIVQYDMTLSAYSFIDSDGNLFKWGNDGSGAIAWGWDYEQPYDSDGSLAKGLFNRYTYEVMYMRGAPTHDALSVNLGLKNQVKVYKDPASGAVSNIAEVKLHLPATRLSSELEQMLHSDLTELKYFIVPYDSTDSLFSIDIHTMTNDQLRAGYDATDASRKGDLISAPVLSGVSAQNLSFEVNIPENGRLIIWAVNEHYAEGAGGAKEYAMTTYERSAFVADNVYTPLTMKHKGIGRDEGNPEREVYSPTNDNVEKVNDDSAATQKPFNAALYGLPLDAHSAVIGAIKNSEGEISLDTAARPTYGYDTVSIKSYEAVGDVGLPSGIKPYWKFARYLDAAQSEEQLTTIQKDLFDEGFLQAEYTQLFFYEKVSDYWTRIEGEKIWVDSDDRLGLRPESITLTLKVYERDTVTGVKGAYIKDLKSIEVVADEKNKWLFDFGSQPSYEYCYEVIEDVPSAYSCTVSYPGLGTGSSTTSEDYSDIMVVNTLNLKPTKCNKVDSVDQPILSDSASFTLKNAVAGKKVLDENGIEQESLVLSTSTQTPFIVIPLQKTGTYLLTETKAPAGYNLLTKDIEVSIDTTGRIRAVLGALELEDIALNEAEAALYGQVFNIVNKGALELPLTGGAGTMPLMLLVVTFFALSALFLRRKNHRFSAAKKAGDKRQYFRLKGGILTEEKEGASP